MSPTHTANPSVAPEAVNRAHGVSGGLLGVGALGRRWKLCQATSAVTMQKTFNAKTPRRKGAKVLETLTARLGRSPFGERRPLSRRPPDFPMFALRLCAFALNSH